MITVDGLSGDVSSAIVRLTPDHWPAQPPAQIGEWLGELTLDGQEAPIERLFHLLDVIHLSGTERLIDTLKQQTGRLASDLTEVKEQLNGLESQRAELGELAEQLQFASPGQAASEGALREEVAAERRQAESELRTARPLFEDLNRANALTAMVQTGDAAEHQHRLRELRQELDSAKRRLNAAETNHSKAVAALGRGTTAQRRVAKVEGQLSSIAKTAENLLVRQEELGGRLESLGIPTAVDQLTAEQRSVLGDAFKLGLERQRRLQLLAARNRRTDSENRLLDDMRVVLDDAVGKDLGATVVARINDLDITVTDLRDGLGLLDGPADNDLEELAATTRDLAEMSELKDIFERRASLQRSDADLRLELERLEPEAAGHDELRNKAAETRAVLDAASAEVRSLTAQIGAMSRSVLGGADVADVEAIIRDLLTKHNVGPDALSAALPDAQAQLLDLQTQAEKLQSEDERLAASEARRRVLRESLRRRSESDDNLRWLSQLAEILTPDKSIETNIIDWPDATWQRLADHVAASRNALNKLTGDVEGMQNLASEFPSQTNAMATAIKNVVEADALAELSSEPIREALFDGGRVRRISFDDESITWTTPSGEIRTRPLAAFSSGQQALGFMRARLEQIAVQPAANRLVFLDEFGAFISADSRRPLAELLTSQELRSLGEQVVVVLPLQTDYADELDQTTGRLHEEYARRADEVADHGYFTEAFTG